MDAGDLSSFIDTLTKDVKTQHMRRLKRALSKVVKITPTTDTDFEDSAAGSDRRAPSAAIPDGPIRRNTNEVALGAILGMDSEVASRDANRKHDCTQDLLPAPANLLEWKWMFLPMFVLPQLLPTETPRCHRSCKTMEWHCAQSCILPLPQKKLGVERKAPSAPLPLPPWPTLMSLMMDPKLLFPLAGKCGASKNSRIQRSKCELTGVSNWLSIQILVSSSPMTTMVNQMALWRSAFTATITTNFTTAFPTHTPRPPLPPSPPPSCLRYHHHLCLHNFHCPPTVFYQPPPSDTAAHFGGEKRRRGRTGDL
jgi:hypothetical protein